MISTFSISFGETMFTPLSAQKHLPFGALAWPEREKINAYHKLPCDTKIVSQHKCRILKSLNFLNLQKKVQR